VFQKTLLLTLAASVVIFSSAAALVLGVQNPPAASLSGLVTSQREGAMEGVLVSAKRADSTITITVVSDAQGRYSFPRNRLDPGQYSVRVRAIGYELEHPQTVSVSAQQTTSLDLKLVDTGDLAYQLSNGEWLMSMPGTDEQKQGLLGCTQCHTLEPIVRSRYTANEFTKILDRMSRYAQGSTRLRPQLRPNTRGSSATSDGMTGREGDSPTRQSQAAKTAGFMSTVNLSSSSRWQYPLKTLPRSKGKATRVIITEYDLPRSETLPHDAAADSTGMIWYSDFGSHYLGVLDPKTGKVMEYPIPITKPGAPVGSLDLVFDKQNDIWLGTMYQGSLAKFDRKTQKFQTWGSPKFQTRDEARIAMVMPIHNDVDDMVWIGGDSEYRVNVRTGEWQAIDYDEGQSKDSSVVRGLSAYGVASDSKNNFYGLNLNGTYIIKKDGKTGKITPYPTPTPNSGPRRGHMDSEDRLWFAEFRGNKIAMFDTRTGKFREWSVPTPWTNVYDAIFDKNEYAWAGGMNNDHVVRVNTKTGEIVEYLLPRTTNIRRVNVDNSTSPPTFWIGNNLEGTLIKVEPLE
jgi:streptogramin lyase